MSAQAVGFRIAAGQPLLFAEVGRSLSAAGVRPVAADATPTATVVISAPLEWSFSTDGTCWYVTAFIEGVPTDSPLGGRHYWMLSKTIRLACAYRMGCVSEVDHKAAVDALEARFTEVLADPRFGTPRAPRPREFAGLVKDGIDSAAAKTDEEARDELGGHEHNVWMMPVTNNNTQQQAPPPQPQAPGPQQPQAGAKGQKPSIATQLVTMAGKHYTFGVGDDGTPYGAEPGRPHIALPLRGGQLGLRTALAARYYRAHKGSVPPSQALANAMVVLEGYAMQQTPQPLHLRVAGHGGRVYIDTADAANRVIEIGGGTWDFVSDAIPVMFRRTRQTAPMPDPVRGGKLSKLWEYIRIEKADRPILVATLVSALIQPDVPHVILAFITEHGSAKSFSTRCLVSLLDPVVAPLQMPPKDGEGWVTTANGSYVVALDNLSTISDWLSDALCRAATGDGHTKRALYTDTDLTVLKFRHIIILNGIDLGGLREDLTDRLAPVDLTPITDRKDEAQLAAMWEQDRPAILGGLLDLAAKVHAKLPGYTAGQLPRMADFARVLGCIDEMSGTKGLEQYQKRAKHLAADGLESDPWMAQLMAQAMSNCKFVDVSAASILALVQPNYMEHKPRSWPQKARTVTTRLSRAAPALRSLGWHISNDNGENKANAIRWTIKPPKVTP
jgi:hypothetical protein